MKAQRVIITGEIGAGKTTLCEQIVGLARLKGIQVCGLISPGVFEGGKKVAIKAVDLASNESRILARQRKNEARGPQTKRWAFLEETVRWGNHVLLESVPCELFVLDELGPIEFQRGEGWVQGLMVLDEGRYEMAVVVIRPHFLAQARDRWGGSEVVDLDFNDGKSRLAEQIIAPLWSDKS